MDAKARADCIKEIDLLKVKYLFKNLQPSSKYIKFFIDTFEVSTVVCVEFS